MAAVNFVRGFTGIVRKAVPLRLPVVTRLGAVVSAQKCRELHVLVNNGKNSLQTRVWRCGYTTKVKLTPAQIEQRVLKVCQAFDKINGDKLTLDSHFINDLGLDSLDHVEVIMAMEDEFSFEIPDADADRLMKPRDIVQYVADKEDVFE